MILKGGEDIGFQAALSGTSLPSGSCSYQLAGEGARDRPDTHKKVLFCGEEKQGWPEGKSPSEFKEINLESFAYKNSHLCILFISQAESPIGILG